MSQTISDASDEIGRLRAQLRSVETRLAVVQRVARLGYWEMDIRNNQGRWSDELCRIYGVPSGRRDLTFEDFLERVHPEDRNAVRQSSNDCITRRASYETQYRIVRPDGEQRVIAARAEAEFDSDGNPTQAIGIEQDITVFSQLQQTLSESEARCRSIFDHVPVGIALVGADQRFTAVNPAWVRMSGYAPEELLGLTVGDITHPDDLGETMDVTERARRGDFDLFTIEKRYVRKNGEVFWGRMVGTVLRDERGAVMNRVAMIEDITEKKDAELRRAEQQRLQRDALVREVHHRVKNSIQGVAGLLERHAAANPALGAAIEELLRRLNALATVHGLQSELAGRELNLCNIARGIVDALQAVSTVPLELALPDGFAPVEVNADEAVPIALILNELVSNAVKHVHRSAERVAVKVELKRDGARAAIVVRSQPARLPPGFDLGTDRFLGTGLRLAKSLLPIEGATLTVSEPAPGVVESVLELWPPVLNLAANAASEA